MSRLGGLSHSQAPVSGTSDRVRATTAARDRASRQIESSTVALSIPVAPALQSQCHFVAHNAQKIHDSVAGLIASVAHSFLPRPIITAGHSDKAGIGLGLVASLNHSEDRDAVNRHAKAPHQPPGGTLAGGMSDAPDDPSQTGGLARVGRRQIGKPFRKDALFAMVIAVPPAGQPCPDRYRRSLDREITQRSPTATKARR
jgi:hypothetical protein